MQHSLTKEDFSRISAGYDEDPLRSSSINTSTYVDEKYLEIEKQSVFKHCWHFVCHEEKLRVNHSYVVADVQGQSILFS